MYEDTGDLINLGYCPHQPARQRDFLPRSETPGSGKSCSVPARLGQVPAGTVAPAGDPSGGGTTPAVGQSRQPVCPMRVL